MTASTLEQASAFLRNKNIKQAAKLYLDLIQIDPNNALAYQGLAICHFEVGQFEDAYELAKKALEIDSSLSIPHRISANVFLRRKDLHVYEHELRQAMLKDPGASDLYINLGWFLANTKRIRESISAFQKAVELDPGRWLPHYCLGSAYVRISNHKDALMELRRAYSLKKTFEIRFAFVSLFMSQNWRWLFPLLIAAFFASFVLPLLASLPLAFVIAGLQLLTSIAYFFQGDIKSGIANAILLTMYSFAWVFIKFSA
jgi:tetratricopeptide (TPR) repeat protein